MVALTCIEREFGLFWRVMDQARVHRNLFLSRRIVRNKA